MYRLDITTLTGEVVTADITDAPAITLQKNTMTDFTSRQTDFSTQVSLPRTPTNDYIFAYIANPTIVAKSADDYDARAVYYTAYLYYEDMLLLGGLKLQINSISREGYNVTLTAPRTFYDYLEEQDVEGNDRMMDEIAPQTTTQMVVTSETDTTAVNEVELAWFNCFNTADTLHHGGTLDAVHQYEVIPSVHSTWAMEKILAAAGYTMQFANSAIEANDKQVLVVGRVPIFSGALEGTFNANVTTSNVPISASDPVKVYSTITNTPSGLGNFKLSDIHTYLKLINIPEFIGSRDTIEVQVSLHLLYTVSTSTAEQDIQIGDTKEVTVYTNTGRMNEVIYQASYDTGELDFLAGANFRFRLDIDFYGQWSYVVDSFITNFACKWSFDGTAESSIGTAYEVQPRMPNVSQKDFVKDWLNMYAANISFDDATKTATIWNLDDVVANKSSAYDWTEKMAVGSEVWEFTLSDEYAQTSYISRGEIETELEKVDWAYGDVVAYSAPISILQRIVNNGGKVCAFTYDTSSGLYKKSSAWNGTIAQMQSWISDASMRYATFEGTAVTTQDRESIAVKNETLAASTELLEMTAKSPIFADDTMNGNVIRYATIPRCNHDTKEEDDGLFFAVKGFMANYDLGTWQTYVYDSTPTQLSTTQSMIFLTETNGDSTINLESLLDKFYGVHKQILADCRVITADFYLDVTDIINFDFMTPVYLEQYKSYFYVLKIENFKVGQLTSVRMVRLPS